MVLADETYMRLALELARQAAEEGAEEAPLYRFDTQTDHTLYFFTDRGNCYPLSVAALPEMKPKDRGALLSGVLAGLEENETPVNILCMKPSELASAPDLLFVTRKGQVKRTAAAEYDVRRAKFAALTLREGDAVMGVLPLDAAADVLIISRSGMSVRFHADGVPTQGRTAGGVKGMTLEPGDAVLWCGQPQAADQVFLMTERGFAKRVLYMDFEPQARGGKGVKCYKITEKTGYVIGVKAVTDENEIMMITTEGIIIQIRMDDVSQLGRITSGVKLINLDAGVTVAQIAKVREKVSDGNQEFDDVDDAMEDVSKPSEVDQEEDDDPAEEHITMPEETEEDE